MTNCEIFEVIKDVVLIVAAAIGSYVALKGLNTWQRQLTGQTEYDLARRILVTLFKYRDAIDQTRHPAMWGDEMPSPPEEEAKEMSFKEIQFYGSSKAYQKRWNNVQTKKSSLYADLVESEAIWGIELKNLFQPIFDLEHELFVQIRHHIELTNPKTPDDHKEAILKLAKEKRDILYSSLGEENDDFRSELLAAIGKIENFLKPYLRREKA
jgi:hypothetical protein